MGQLPSSVSIFVAYIRFTSHFAAGALLSQYLVGEVHEQTLYSSIILIQGFLAVVVQFLGVGSAAMFFLVALPLFVSLVVNSILIKTSNQTSQSSIHTHDHPNGNGTAANGQVKLNGVNKEVVVGGPEQRRVSLWTYAVGQTLPLITGTMILLGVIEFFVPLVGISIVYFAHADHFPQSRLDVSVLKHLLTTSSPPS